MGMNTKLGALLATTGIALAFGAGAAFADTIQVDKGGDISALCGEKPTRIALVDGYGGDTWRKITEAELRDEASKYANITEIAYGRCCVTPA